MKKLSFILVASVALAPFAIERAEAANLLHHWLLNDNLTTLSPDYEPEEDRAVAVSLVNQVSTGSQAGQFVKGTTVSDPAPLSAPAPTGAAANGSTGAVGTAFKDSHIELGAIAPGTDPFTISLWFNRDGSASTEGLHNQFHIIGANQGQANRWSLHAQNLNASTGQFALSFFHHGGWNNGSNSATLGQLQSDTWYHVAMTRGADDSFVIYLDGVAVVTGTNPNSFTQGDNGVVVGRDAVLRETTNWSFLGLFDDIRFYDDALTAEQVASLVIPEPSTYAAILSGFALFGALLLRRRRS